MTTPSQLRDMAFKLWGAARGLQAANNEQASPFVMGPIVEAVAAEYGIPPQVIRGPNRKRSVYIARAEAMLRAREKGMSLTRIGKYFGGRDHSTVHTALRKARLLRRMTSNDPIR